MQIAVFLELFKHYIQCVFSWLHMFLCIVPFSCFFVFKVFLCFVLPSVL